MRQATSLLLFVALATALGSAQAHGVPSSVTSFGFGGSLSSSPGIPASVTSLGPQGFQCCVNVGMSGTRHFISQGDPRAQNFHHHEHGFPVYVPLYQPVYTPTYVQVEPYVEVQPDVANDDEEDGGGPTIFDRRGPRRHAAYDRVYDRGYDEGRAAEQDRHDRDRNRDRDRDRENAQEARAVVPGPSPAPSAQASIPAVEPKTALVFRDGHKEEVVNYAIVGDQLYDFTSGKRRIAITELDIPATAKANEARGMDFQLPTLRSGS